MTEQQVSAFLSIRGDETAWHKFEMVREAQAEKIRRPDSSRGQDVLEAQYLPPEIRRLALDGKI